MHILLIWLFFRSLTWIFTTLVSSNHPLTLLEKSISITPLAITDSNWLERTLLSPWLRWDAAWYQRIVENGYNAVDGTAQFHPLFPGLASLLQGFGVHPLLSLLLISSFSCLGFLFLYYKLARFDLSTTDARVSVLLILLAPAGFVLFAPYPESLFLLCAACSLYFMRTRQWWLAGLAGSLATLTRQQGFLLLFPLAYELWEASERSWKRLTNVWHKILPLTLIPISYLLWIGYRTIGLKDNVLKTDSFQNFIYSVLISPSSSEVVPQQTFTWPWRAIWLSLHKLFNNPDIDIWVNLILAAIFLILLGMAWKKMGPAFRLYAGMLTLVSFSYHTGSYHPYMGLPRHLLLAFPVFIYASPIINHRFLRPVILTILGVLYLLSLYLFCLEAWVA